MAISTRLQDSLIGKAARARLLIVGMLIAAFSGKELLFERAGESKWEWPLICLGLVACLLATVPVLFRNRSRLSEEFRVGAESHTENKIIVLTVFSWIVLAILFQRRWVALAL